MTVEELIQIGSQLPGTTSDIKWDHHICLNVGDKMYLITSPDAFPINASVKISDERFEEMISKPGVKNAPYLGRYKWVEIDDISRFSQMEWKEILISSYQLIGTKLSSKKKKEIGFNL